MLAVLCEHTERAWQYWLSRRSHKGHIHWQKYEETVRQQLPLPEPRILHSIEQRQGQQKLCTKREVACLVSHWQQLLATEEPDKGNLPVRICGEGAG